MAHLTRLVFLVVFLASCTRSLGLAITPNNNNPFHALDKRGTGVGELDENVRSIHYNRRISYGCGKNICYSPSCVINWTDSHGCYSIYEIRGICDTFYIWNKVHKGVCGGAWIVTCSYTNDYIATFMWNSVYELSVTNTKKSRLSSGFNVEAGRSCKYGMLLHNNYRGSYTCADLIPQFQGTMNNIPYDGC